MGVLWQDENASEDEALLGARLAVWMSWRRENGFGRGKKVVEGVEQSRYDEEGRNP